MKDRFTNEYILQTAGLMLVVAGILFMVSEDPAPLVAGWVFGSVVSMLMFKLMYLTLLQVVEKEEGKASRFAAFHYLLRYLLYGAVLVVAAKAEYLHLVTTFFGLLSVKYVILIRNMFDYLRSKKGGDV